MGSLNFRFASIQSTDAKLHQVEEFLTKTKNDIVRNALTGSGMLSITQDKVKVNPEPGPLETRVTVTFRVWSTEDFQVQPSVLRELAEKLPGNWKPSS